MYTCPVPRRALAVALTLAISSSLASASSQAAQPTLEEKIEILQRELEELKTQFAKQSVAAASINTGGSGASAAGGGATTVGGYGEVSYNNYRDGSVKDQADLKRFILFLGHKFNDRLRFFSELEVEHAFAKDGKAPANGELEMEQAYLEYALTDTTYARAGLMIVPAGIINETHEPPTFYGVERNEVESRIIPSTWREIGVALRGQAAPGLEYNVGMSTTPDASQYKDAAKGFRDLRTSGSKATANDLGVFGALNYRAVPGALLGASVFRGNTGQDGNGATAKAALVGVDAPLTLWDVHAKYTLGKLDLQGLYARGTLGDTAAINAAAGLAAGSNKAAPKSFHGWYGQAAYHLWQSGEMELNPFVRYERYNTQDKVDAGFAIDPRNDERVTTAGFNFMLHPQVVLKADYQNYKVDPAKDRFNLGVGYMF